MVASVPPVAVATLTRRRSAPAAPTETVLAILASEPLPSATEFVALAVAKKPKAAL